MGAALSAGMAEREMEKRDRRRRESWESIDSVIDSGVLGQGNSARQESSCDHRDGTQPAEVHTSPSKSPTLLFTDVS